GGGLISNDGTAKNSVIQQLGFGEKLAWGRSTFSLFDVVNQLPETSFGFSLPGSSVRLPGGQGVLLEPIFTPNQSILTTRGPGVSFLRTVSPAGSTPATSSSRQVYWALDTSMTYQKGRSTFGLAYDRSLSGGAGILPGAITDQMTGSFNSQFPKAFTGGITA